MMHDRKPRDFLPMDMDGTCSEASKEREKEREREKTVRLAHGAFQNAEELGWRSGPAEII